jgi:hypothetical protein
MADFELWDDKDERLADALARAYKHQMGVRTIHILIYLWGVAGNDFLLETEISIAADTLTPTKEKPQLLTVTFVPDGYTPPKPPEPPKPKDSAIFGFGFFGGQPASEPAELEPPEPKPYHLKLRKEAIIRWFKERLLTKMEDSYDADDDIDYLALNPNWSDEDEAAVMRQVSKAG